MKTERLWANRLVWGQGALLLGYLLFHRLASGAGGLLARLDLEGWLAVLVLALVTLNMWAWVRLSPPERARLGWIGLGLLAALIAIGLLISSRLDVVQILALPLLSLPLLAGARAVVDRPAVVWVGLLALLVAVFYLPLTHLDQAQMPGALKMLLSLGMAFLPGLATAVVALLLASALRLQNVPQPSGLHDPHVHAGGAPDVPQPSGLHDPHAHAGGTPDVPQPSGLHGPHAHAGGVRYTQRPARLAVLLRLVLAAALLLALVYSAYWSAAWDQTSDGLYGLFFAAQAVMGALWASMLLSNVGGPRTRLVGSLFAVAVPVVMIAAFVRGQDLPYQDLTEQRAARLETALESFHARHARYPERLSELALRELLFVPRPMMFYSEDWCYQGGADFYRLGAFYRDYFSTPLSLRVFAQAGEPSEEWECAARLAEMQARYDPPPLGASQP